MIKPRALSSQKEHKEIKKIVSYSRVINETIEDDIDIDIDNIPNVEDNKKRKRELLDECLPKPKNKRSIKITKTKEELMNFDSLKDDKEDDDVVIQNNHKTDKGSNKEKNILTNDIDNEDLINYEENLENIVTLNYDTKREKQISINNNSEGVSPLNYDKNKYEKYKPIKRRNESVYEGLNDYGTKDDILIKTKKLFGTKKETNSLLSSSEGKYGKAEINTNTNTNTNINQATIIINNNININTYISKNYLADITKDIKYNKYKEKYTDSHNAESYTSINKNRYDNVSSKFKPIKYNVEKENIRKKIDYDILTRNKGNTYINDNVYLETKYDYITGSSSLNNNYTSTLKKMSIKDKSNSVFIKDISTNYKYDKYDSSKYGKYDSSYLNLNLNKRISNNSAGFSNY